MKKLIFCSAILVSGIMSAAVSAPLGKYGGEYPSNPAAQQPLPDKLDESKKAELIEREIRIQKLLDNMSDSERERWLKIYQQRMETALRNNQVQEARFYQKILDNARNTP